MTGKILVIYQSTSLKLSCHPVKLFQFAMVLVAVLGCNKIAVSTLAEARVNPALPSFRPFLLSSSHTPYKEYILFVRRHVHRKAMHNF
jgi:hypothetical protein